MENQVTSNGNPKAGQVLGIIGFVLGILALIISFIPCFGVWAIVPGIVAIILSVVAYMQANKAGAAKGLIIAAIVVSVIGTSIAIYWGYVLNKASDVTKEQLEKSLEELNKK